MPAWIKSLLGRPSNGGRNTPGANKKQQKLIWRKFLMLKNMTVAFKLGAGFGLVVLLLILTAFVGISRLGQLNASVNDIVTDKWAKIDLLQTGLAGVNDIAIGSRDMVMADKNRDAWQKAHDRVLEGRGRIGKAWEQLKPTLKNPKGQEMMQAILESRERFIAAQEQIIKFTGEGKTAEALLFMDSEFRPAATEYRKRVDALVDFQVELMNDAGKQAAETFATAKNLMIIISLVAVLIAALLGFLITRGLVKQLGGEPGYAAEMVTRIADGDLTVNIQVKPGDTTSMLYSIKNMVDRLSQIVAEIRGSAVSLTSASEEVSATAQSMSQATNEQAASVEETSASVEQMSASISQNTENAKVTEGIASKAAKDANEGGAAVSQTVSAMKQIADKIGIIDDIAYQTNLLALNAAIEAARAGEHGKGFAVVAAEVRKLAERSQVAAQEIGEVAKGSVDLAEKAGKLLDEIVPSINKTSDLVQEITAASEEQSSGAGQINTAMDQLNQITQQNASSSEELAATAEEMSASAEQLQQLVSYFNVGDNQVDNVRAVISKAAGRSVKSGRSASIVSSDADEGEFVKF
jgi:methyl-accepting chemotaxis protein